MKYIDFLKTKIDIATDSGFEISPDEVLPPKGEWAGMERLTERVANGTVRRTDVMGESVMLTHFSLFTGIGGLDLAAEWAGFQTVGQCEYADYPTKVLEKYWPDVPRWRDVRELTVEHIRERGIKEITVLSGGFPCQPHSLAGKRKASADERDLWPEYRRLIGEIRPKWVVAENVRGLLTSEDGRFFRGILRDFADMGFDVGWCTYPACWVGAVHRRERVFIIAHSNNTRERTPTSRDNKNGKEKDGQQQPLAKLNRHYETVANPYSKRPRGHIAGYNRTISERNTDAQKWLANRIFTSLCGGTITICRMGDSKQIKPIITRNDDGFSGAMDRLKCLGNAVVPQQAYPIFKAIADIERSYNAEQNYKRINMHK